ncbi:hypothetical protein M406DRAFT_103681 [Cryphonectria parasitica EP155]|uniref:Uncharacterized protein n=1 Tax=Cryphonectria parasitica (strain ATCC 38755 / EP155) TaxID=660469 RepID=A0A9P4XYH6_CRYP1|nr:uncharacterized protein M406DRAFT_103681 [Cryphonectria parasitica EP155]KAF3763107.1 hypothetical protein M406DRAFT_103681 [Cryphonectria parasitica EP155]
MCLCVCTANPHSRDPSRGVFRDDENFSLALLHRGPRFDSASPLLAGRVKAGIQEGPETNAVESRQQRQQQPQDAQFIQSINPFPLGDSGGVVPTDGCAS